MICVALYLSHIATWKQDITNLSNRSGETWNRTPDLWRYCPCWSLAINIEPTLFCDLLLSNFKSRRCVQKHSRTLGWNYIEHIRSSDDVVVKLLACGARGPGFDSRSRCYDFRNWLSPASKSRYGWKISKLMWILKTTNQTILEHIMSCNGQKVIRCNLKTSIS